MYGRSTLWKQGIGRRLGEVIVVAVPGVCIAVKWNSPFYGAQGKEVWFLSFYCFEKCVKVTFFRGQSLLPVPPGESKSQDTRYLDIREDAEFDEDQLVAWIKQASKLPGEKV